MLPQKEKVGLVAGASSGTGAGFAALAGEYIALHHCLRDGDTILTIDDGLWL